MNPWVKSIYTGKLKYTFTINDLRFCIYYLMRGKEKNELLG